MFINHKLLQHSMNKCFVEFVNYYDLISQQWEQINQFLSDSQNEYLYKSIMENEDKSNLAFRENISRIEWYICQHTPVANNLRFFLTILMSLKDLERCGDYVCSIAKFIKYVPGREPVTGVTEIIKIWPVMIKKIHHMWDIFIKNSKKLNSEQFNEILEIKEVFFGEFKSFLKKINLLYTNKINNSPNEEIGSIEDMSYVFAINVKIDRTIDHVLNIIENFYLIDNTHLYPQIDIKK